MAFNLLAFDRDVDGIVAAIRGAEPDLIALAELTPTLDAALAERLGATYPYRTLRRLEGARFGSGIYSRWPFDDLGSLQTGLGLRSAAADVHTPDGVVRFVTLHPRATLLTTSSYDRATLSVEKSFRGREAQLAAVCRYLDQWGDRPVILAGDLNSTEFSDAYRCVAQRLGDSYREAGYGLGHTWPSPEYSVMGRLSLLTRIDYVFHSHHWVAVDARVLEIATGSDHRPVVVELKRVP